MGGKRKATTRDDVHSRPSSLPVTLYADCQHPHRSMQALMGLGNDKQKMRSYVETMSVCASRHLDPTKSYTQQPKETLAKYVRSVLSHIEIMEAYEDTWPATTYARMWLNWSHTARQGRGRQNRKRTKSAPANASRRAGTSTQKASRGQTERPGNTKENDVPSKQTPNPENTPQPSQTMSTIHSTGAAQATTPTLSRTLRLGTDSQSAPPPNQCQRLSRARRQREDQSPSASSSTTLSTSDFVNPVATFLNSLAQPLGHLLPVFHAAGVRNAGSLRGLARLRNRGDWLYVLVVDRKVTPLEYKFIVDGLDDLVEAKQE